MICWIRAVPPIPYVYMGVGEWREKTRMDPLFVPMNTNLYMCVCERERMRGRTENQGRDRRNILLLRWWWWWWWCKTSPHPKGNSFDAP
jgi:hypothetical protein